MSAQTARCCPALLPRRQAYALDVSVASLVDGTRTVADIAAALAADWNISRDALLEPVLRLLSQLG